MTQRAIAEAMELMAAAMSQEA
ncbi:hypothetical protein A2U01_0089364, partial [Trifolium medium]|nr:hypothetical protein [Trifolium medium]